MLHISFAEDDQAMAAQLRQFLERYTAEHELEADIRAFSSGDELLREYDTTCDILLLDVEMPGSDGMETARALRERDAGVVIVFITNIARYAVQGYEVEAHGLHPQTGELFYLQRQDGPGGAPDTELEQAIDNYDGMIRTGNEVLNTVLTEKSLLCEERGIRLTCVADGTALDFLEATDLYGLFSIAMDNAIETVSSFADSDRRLVEVLVCRRQDFAVINISNPICGNPSPEEGRLWSRTSVQDFGFKGLRRIVRKYDGMLDLDSRDGMFTLRAVIPLEQAVA